MESLIIWGGTAVVAALIILPYFLRFRKAQKESINRRMEAEAMGAIRPTAQYPLIDQSRCIGCGTCVSVCPEGDVLGVVYGKAVIINGLRCVGHGHCETACPVSAITVGLGDITTRDDIPILDETHQSVSVPGMYVVGELGGLSLIRNAITQGQAAVESIAATRGGAADGSLLDVIIVGAGPAGLTAALSAIEHNLSYLVLDQQAPGGTILQYPRRKLVMTQPVEIPLYGKLERSEYEKEELLAIWEDAIERFDVRMKTRNKVERVEATGDRFRVITADGTFESRNVVLALGRRGTPRKLGVPGEDQSKVMYQLLDAQAYDGKHVLVVGGGDSAVEAAVGLARQKGTTVTVSYRKSRFFRIKKKNQDRIDKYIAQKRVSALFESNVKEIRESTVVLETPEGTVEIPNDFVFVFAGGIPPFKMLKEMGIAFGGETQDWQEQRQAG